MRSARLSMIARSSAVTSEVTGRQVRYQAAQIASSGPGRLVAGIGSMNRAWRAASAKSRFRAPRAPSAHQPTW